MNPIKAAKPSQQSVQAYPPVHEQQQGMLEATHQAHKDSTAHAMGIGSAHSFEHLPLFPRNRAFIQPKLMVNSPGDAYEQEADRMAERVMRMPAAWKPSTLSDAGREAQRLHCNKGGGQVMRKAGSGTGFEAPPPVAAGLGASKGSGFPLPAATRLPMEGVFGVDLSAVRIHTGSQAAAMNRAVQARAFTHKSDIYFNQGQYSPAASEGRRLLAHELTHVVQQNHVGVPTTDSGVEYDRMSRANGELLQMSPGDASEIAGRIKALIHTPDPVAGPNLAYKAFPILEGLDDQTMVEVLNQLSGEEINELIVSDSTGKSPRIAAALDTVFRSKQAGTTTPVQTTASPFVQANTTAGATLGATPGHTVQAFYFQGTSNRKALILGGVHGSEPGGVEVVRNLLDMLRGPNAPVPFFSVVIVPELFSANVHSSRPLADRRTSGGTVPALVGGRATTVTTPDPNRQFPAVGSNPTTNSTLGCIVDEQNRCIEPENLVLLDLINRFQPERVANVHGHSIPTDRPARASPPRPAQTAREVLLAEGGPSITTDPRPGHEREDDALTLTMAREAHRRHVGVPGNFIGTADQTTRYPTGTAPRLSAGVSFGAWGSHATPTRPAMNIVLIETFGNRTSANGTAAEQAARRVELVNLAEILRDFFLVDPSTI